MTPSARATSPFSGLRRLSWTRIAQIGLLVLVVLVVVGCAVPASSGAPGASGSPVPTHSPAPPLEPAKPGDPVSTLAWLFTPIFQVMFIILVAVYDFFSAIGAPAAIAWAIVILTLLVRTVVIPLYRRQLVSQRRDRKSVV